MRAPKQKDIVCHDGLLISDREDFSDYLWMEDEESFDKQVFAELEEEDEMEQCMEEMLAEEEARDTTYYVMEDQSLTGIPCSLFLNIIPDDIELLHSMANMNFYEEEVVLIQSELNPDAEEFIPSNVSPSSIEPSPETESTPKTSSDSSPDR